MRVILYEITSLAFDFDDEIDVDDAVDAAFEQAERGFGDPIYTELDPNNWEVQ